MKYNSELTATDHQLSVSSLQGFMPDEIYDIHTHPYHPAHFAPDTFPFLKDTGVLACQQHRDALLQYMPVKTIYGLYFGMPHKNAARPAMNSWVGTEVKENGTALSRALMVVSPQDAPEQVARDLRSGLFCGVKVYHCYASRPDTMNASLTEYVPEWLWELLHEINGVLLLHIVRDGAMEDPDNQREVRRLCRTYPNVKLILAHVGRSFNYRNARSGLYSVVDLDNVVIDTSAVTESESFAAALRILGPRRVLWGSDFPVSELRGRCVTTGAYFFWLHPELIDPKHRPPTTSEMTLVGIESLLTLREACEDAGLTQQDVSDLFLNNALRLLKPHLPQAAVPQEETGPALWKHAREVISGGTGLLSKRAEMFDQHQWPAYFSKSSGCEVWDMAGRRYLDFAGGIGAVLLGYADPDVNAAVQRRVLLGSYSSLVNPQEVELADLLLELHPWAGKVRYARGGGDALVQAVRIARAATGKSGIAFCGYHGWHDWYLAANLSDDTALDGHLLPGLEPKGVPRELRGTSVPFRYNDFESFEAALNKLGNNLAGVVMEPMRSQYPQDDFLNRVAARCRESGAVFVVDEVTSGLRYGFPGALSKLGVEPDLAVYAKAMSNGFPFGVVIGRDDIMQKADASFISSSYWTDGVGTAAALAVLKKMKALNAHETVWNKGVAWKEALETIAARYPGCGLLVGGMPVSPSLQFQLGQHSGLVKTRFIAKMLEKGILASSALYLMVAHQDQHIQAFLEAFEQALKELEPEILGGLENSRHDGQNQLGFARLA
ncbi:aminotransferase class III-fold pyridoxal phosphate-dependent enzyme [Larkinella bovis]|uniref:aminotransferase class III-fold pyridoxal phosphate-dependent enzyme n=1 Tax=Larkinella bovis TaxID=683041 RepID=UPI0036D352CF